MLRARESTTDVFVVDPQPVDYQPLATAMAADGFVFQFATSGNEALRFSPAGSARVWLVNIELPDMTGFDLCRLVHGRRAGAVLYLVGNRYRLEDELQCRAAGKTLYVCKPPQADWVRQARCSIRIEPVCGAPAAPG